MLLELDVLKMLFRTYKEHDFEYLDEKSFKYLYNLYQKIYQKIDENLMEK